MSGFGGLLMGALGNTFTNVANEHRAEDKQIRQETRAMDAYRGKKDIDTEYARAEETRQQEISVARQKQIMQAITQMPDEVQQSPMAVAKYFASQGMTDYAKDFVDMMKTSAEIGATGALERQREAYADNDTRNTDSQIAERGRSSRGGGGLIGDAIGGFDPQSTQGKVAADMVAAGVFPDIQAAMNAVRDESLTGEAMRAVLQNPGVMAMKSEDVARLVRDTAQRLRSTGSAPAPAGPTVSMDNFPIKPDVK